MAKLFLTCIEESVAHGFTRALAIEQHQIEHRSCNAPVGNFVDADIAFADGLGKEYRACSCGEGG